MSGKFPFAAEQSLILQEGSPGWNDQTLDYSDAASGVTLTDSISESYVTAVGDNETHYLSVLENTGDETLEGLHNLTLSNSKGEEQKSVIFNENGAESNEDRMDVIDLGDQQVVVFTVDGSNDLYGIQVAQDEEGNLQKYQFKFRSTDDGQIEAVPESFQLLPNDDTHPDNSQDDHENLLLNDIAEENFMQDEEQDENIINFALETQESDQVENIEESEEIFIKGERTSPELHVEHSVLETDNHIKVEHRRQKKSIPYQPTDESQEECSDEFHRKDPSAKTGILVLQDNSENIDTTPGHIKQEFTQEEFQEFANEYDECAFEQIEQNLEDEDTPQNQFVEIPNQEGVEESNESFHEENHEELQEDEDHCIAYHMDTAREDLNNFDQLDENSQTSSQDDEEVVSVTVQELHDQEHYEEVFVQESRMDMLDDPEAENNGGKEPEFEENDSENDEYQIVEGLHITGDIDAQHASSETQQLHQSILQEVLEKPIKSSILKNSMLLPSKKGEKIYYFYKYPEKENVNSLTDENIFKPFKINPRSILKSSFIAREKISSEDEKLNKRFARNKEAVQAKLFQNFISKTTIQYAPERTTRLPRKQEIKPVDERRDAEIIVQEVLVSPNGFVEDIGTRLKNRDKLHVTAIVELSDSEDEASRTNSHNANGHSSDLDIIEINSDDDDCKKNANFSKRSKGRPKKPVDVAAKDVENQSDILKRRRGRPPKSTKTSPNPEKRGNELEESPSKRSRTDSDSEGEKKDAEEKKEIECPHCPKTFPSQNSLNTHIQHHNLENKLKNTQKHIGRVSCAAKQIEYKHKCEKCEATFKNTILLGRHVCPKKPDLSCSVCLKKFKDSSALEVHKRVHVKENLIKSTNTAKVSPKRPAPRFSTFKAPGVRARSPKPTPASFKCKDCSRVCTSLSELTVHSKTHQKFTCSNCSAVFASRILLDTHIRINCVKQKSPANKRLSFKIKKSFVASPRRTSVAKKPVVAVAAALNATVSNSTMNKSGLFNLECELCGQKFSTYKGVYLHKVRTHGMDTPDKSLLEKPKKRLYKPKATHGGIPANERLRKAYLELRKKLELEQDRSRLQPE